MRHACEGTVLRKKKKNQNRSGAFSYGKNKSFRKVQIWHPRQPPLPVQASLAGKCHPRAQQQNSSRWRPAVFGRSFLSPFLGQRPETCRYYLQKTAYEHVRCCSQLGMHTAVRGQSNHVPHSHPASYGRRRPSLQQERSSSFSPKKRVFIC